MRRAALLVAIALALLTGGAQAAGELALTVVSQTSSTITLGWTPQPGYGYLFSTKASASAPLVLQSRTNDASRSSARFSKTYAYEVAVIVKGATGVYPGAPASPACSDGADNDSDGKIDYPADPGCTSASDTNETDPPPPAAQCADGVDNDSDGKVDIADPGCSSATDNDETDPVAGGSVFLAANGNDGNACTQAAPCRSMQRGFAVAQAGQTVTMAAGSYSQQSLVNAQKQVRFQGAGNVTLTGQLELRCTTGITVANVSAKNLLVAAGNRNLVVRDSAFGGGTYTAGVEDDPVVIGNVGSCSGGTTSDGVVLDNVRVHDYFWQQNTGSAHTDCLQFYGGSTNVTIRNSLFERCAESFIGAFPDFGDIRNTVVEDTVFRDLWTNTGKGTFFAMQWGCVGHSGVGTGITFRRTTWSPGVPVPIRTDCQNFLVENNTFQTGPGQFACDDWDGRWGGTVVWRNNTFLNGNGCTT